MPTPKSAPARRPGNDRALDDDEVVSRFLAQRGADLERGLPDAVQIDAKTIERRADGDESHVAFEDGGAQIRGGAKARAGPAL
jgi:hypothetical protein